MKQHKFFERYLGNDLDDLWTFLDNKYDELLDGTMPEGKKLSPLFRNKFSKADYISASSKMLNKYNVFDFNHEGINNLEKAIKDMVVEACEYYGVDFDSQDYVIHGWWNQSPKIKSENYISPLVNPKMFHDHLGGRGAPDFHGYYCVHAEPSITYYLIDGKDLFHNENKDDRAIVSATGHQHARDDWFGEKDRITIAYDIVPRSYVEELQNTTSTFRPFKY